MRTEVLIESEAATLPLTPVEANALRAAGKRLASDKTWWGATAKPGERSVIRCSPDADGVWSLRVADAVGVISVGELQIEVRPKIPVPHLLYLFCESGAFPRLDTQVAGTATGATLWELVAKWYLHETEKLLRQDLMRDYQEQSQWLTIIRGHVNPSRTYRALAAGRFEALCDYEDFDVNSELNRVLKRAAHIVEASTTLSLSDRRRARRIRTRMDGIGDYVPGDERIVPDRRTGYYAAALTLAKHIIAGNGRSIEAGSHYAQTFLIRTPEMVEEGIRRILQRGLKDQWKIEKRGRQIVGTTMTFNPDLVIDEGVAVADVKYKMLGPDWNRTDLYQLVAFATEYRAPSAAIVGFKAPMAHPPARIQVGTINLDVVYWTADSKVAPHHADASFVSDFQKWLSASSINLSSQPT